MCRALILLIALASWPSIAAALEPRDIVGKWRSSFGATAEYHADFTYEGHFMDEIGGGKWQLRRGDTLRLSTYSYHWKKTFTEDYKILSLAKGVMRLKTPEGVELWFRQK